MFEAALAIIKAIWPYLRESVFEGGTVFQWIQKYKAMLIWLTMVFVLFMINTYMFDQYVNLQIERNNLVTNYNRFYGRYHRSLLLLDAQNKKMVTLGTRVQILTKELEAKKAELAALEQSVEQHRRWESKCGLNSTAIESGRASCPVARRAPIANQPVRKPTTKPKPPRTVPESQPEVKKPTFAEKLKKIFGGSGGNNGQ